MQKEILNDNTDVTANSQQIELLKKHFPQCFDKDGNFIVHKMEEIVGESGLDLSKESYSLNWLGKSYARLLANEKPRTLLKEDKAHNAKEQNKESQNLLIKGDNLEVLKHLSHAYAESIKMIYIDPPYNTGSDGFVYNDDRKFRPDELSRLAGIDIDEAKRILEFTQSNANSHSAWLTFMYPRLYVVRHLLRDDGVIFISIDDNEQAQLKLLCDEIFGEENFAGTICWKKKTNGNNVGSLPPVHDFILAYGNVLDKDTIPGFPDNTKYTNSDNHPDGPWTTMDLSANHEGPNFPITNPKNGKVYYPPAGRYWVFNEEEVKKRIQDGRIIFGKTGNAAPVQRVFKKDRIGKKRKMETWWDSQGYNSDGTDELSQILGPKIFIHAKPTKLLKNLIMGSTEKNSTILDFFAGSGTTAHAVMQLNAEDGGNRKFISVQIPEETDKKSEAFKAGYKTIFDITKARIEKAAAKISKEHPDYKGDLGFKIYETIPVWEGYLDDIEELSEDTTLFDGSKLSDAELEVLLTTWKVHDGMELSHELKEIEFAGYKGYLGEGTLYLVDSDFDTETLKALLEKLDGDEAFEPSRVVVFGYNFGSKAQRELDEALRSYANKKSIELDLVVRY